MLTLHIAGLLVRIRVQREIRRPTWPVRDFRADSQQQVLHLLYSASAPRR